MKHKTVDTRLNNNNNINDAAYEILNEWRNTQDNEMNAYMNMCKALRHVEVKLELLIGEALQ